jgi:O-antigen/teichoic acid export membrane protein
MRLRELFAETLKHFFVYGAGLALARATTLILAPLYTRSLTVEEYGVFTILSITLVSISTTAQLGISSSLLRSYFDYNDEDSRKELIGTALIMICCSTLLFALVFVLLSKSLSKLITGSSHYAICLQLLGITLVVESIFSVYMSVLRAETRSVTFGLVNLVKLIITCLAAILFVVVMSQGVQGAIAANAISSSLLCLLIMPSLLKRSKLHLRTDELKKLLGFGIPLIPMSLSSAILASADRYFLIHMSSTIEQGKEAVGIYSLIYTYSNIFRLGIIEPLAMTWLPQMLAARNSKHANQFYTRTFTIYIIASCFLVTVLTVAYAPVVKIVCGSAYAGSSFVVWLILLSLVCIGSTRLLGIGMTFARKTTYSALFYGIAAAINTVLNLLLIPRFGMLGAAIATVGGAFVLPILYYHAGQKYYALEYEWPAVSKNLLIFLAISVAYFVVSTLPISNNLKTVVVVIIVASYFPAVLLAGILKPREVQNMLTLSKSKVAPSFSEPSEE